MLIFRILDPVYTYIIRSDLGLNETKYILLNIPDKTWLL